MTKSITITAAGDLAPLHSITEGRPEVKQVWQRFREADIAMANLEISLTTSMVRADKAITLKADPSVAGSLAAAGLDVVSLANNHAFDFGAQGLFDTMEALNQAGVAAIGGGADLASALAPAILERKGLRIACLALCSALPTGFAAAETRPGVAPVRARSRFYIDSMTLDEQPGISPWVETSLVAEDADAAARQVAAAKAQADFVIVNIHWGIPHGWCALFQGPLADYQQPLAHQLIDAGAGLIIGHHAHVIHGLERYGKGVIAYSLGNFLFHSMADDHVTKLTTKYPPYSVESLETGEAREAVILEATVNNAGLQELCCVPVAFNSQGEPEYLRGERAEQVLGRLAAHSRKLGAKLAVDGGIARLI